MKRKNEQELEKIIERAEKVDYDKKGNAIIMVGIKSKKDFYDPYCDNNYKTLNESMLSYIEKNADEVPNNESIALEFITEENLTQKEKQQMADAIRRQYAENLVAINRKLRKNMFLVALLSILGVALLALAIYLEKIEISSILDNTVMIIAWVFLWDGAEHFFFNHMTLLRQKHRTKKFLNCEITFK